MTFEKTHAERRHDIRVSPKGAVIARADTYVFHGRIANLSRRGIAVSTRTTAPERLLGAPVELALRFDDGAAEWLEISGRVLRIGANSIVLALADAPWLARMIETTVAQSHRNNRTLSIVLVDGTPDRRAAIAEAFRCAGCAVIETTTPLEAIVRLGESQFEPDLIAIADSLPAKISDELRQFVAAEHPRARLVTIGDTATAPDGLLHWLSSQNANADLAARIRTLLTTFAGS